MENKTLIDSFTWKWMTRTVPKQLFNKPLILNNSNVKSGWAIDHMTLLFFRKENAVEINYFEMSGKIHSDNYLFPQNIKELLDKMKYHLTRYGGDLNLIKTKLQ